MGRPRKVKPETQIEIPEPSIRPTPTVIDPRFGYSRPAPKPSQTKKKRGGNIEESEE